MKAAQIPKPGADFEIVEREIPKPSAGQVRISVTVWKNGQRVGVGWHGAEIFAIART
jgi:D-arabinose 1-dehydrogenase-like Zn-dependent alcohol dehydrogenase